MSTEENTAQSNEDGLVQDAPEDGVPPQGQPQTQNTATPAQTAIVVSKSKALAPNNPTVIVVSKRLGWLPQTLVRRVENALSAPIEQDLYLAVASSINMHPESMNILLREFLGQNRFLKSDDFIERVVGPNLVTSRYKEVADELELALQLHRKVSLHFGVNLSMTNLARLIKEYGTAAEGIIDSIMAHYEEIRRLMGFRSEVAGDRQVGITLDFIVKTVLAKGNSMPTITDVLDFFSDPDDLLRHTLAELKGEE